MADRVIVEILVAAPIETVWKAVLDPVEAQRWFGWDYPNLAADLVEMWKDSRSDETKREIWSDNMPDRFTFEDLGTHTVVRLVRSAPAGADLTIRTTVWVPRSSNVKRSGMLSDQISRFTSSLRESFHISTRSAARFG